MIEKSQTKKLVKQKKAFQPVKLIWNHSRDAIKFYLQFLISDIENENTKSAYSTAIRKFSDWIEFINQENNSEYGLEHIDPFVIAAYRDEMKNIKKVSIPTIKQNLSALNRLFNYLVINRVIPSNPAAPVRSPKYQQKKGKAPVLQPHEARKLMEKIDTSTLRGKRDKAMIAVMIYTFARVSATVNMKVKDFYQQGSRYFFRFFEKGGKLHSVPAHPEAIYLVYDYLKEANLQEDLNGYLFRSFKNKRKLNSFNENPLTRQNVFDIVRERAKEAELSGDICCHTFRATGITTYLLGGGNIEKAAMIANHELTSTTKLYDHSDDELTESEIEKIKF